MKTIDQLVRKFYGLSVLAHVSHENTRVFAQHDALGEFYELVNTMKDRLIEYSIGTGYLTKVSVPILEIGTDILTESAATAQMFCELAEDMDDEALCNMAGEFEEAVGKLKFLFLFK